MKGCPFDNAVVKQIAAGHNVSAAQVCLRYVLDRGGIIACGTGADSSTVASYAKENLDIYGFALTPAEMTALSGIQGAMA